jgi:hypothetical protein
MSPCPVCGLDPDSISPPDALATVRSLSRRFRALLAAIDEEFPEDAEELARRPAAPGGPSALDLVRQLASELRRVAAGVDQAVWGRTSEPASANAPDTLDGALADLDGSAAHLADVLDSAPADAWTRPDGQGVTAARLAGEAAHAGSHSVREAERILSEVRGRPSG